MAVSQAQIDALETALLQGTLSVEFDGQKVVYRSVQDLERAISYARGALSAQANGGVATTTSFASYSRD